MIKEVTETTYLVGKEEFKHKEYAKNFEDFLKTPYDRINIHLNHTDKNCAWPKEHEYRIVFDRIMSMKSQYDHMRAMFGNWLKL